MQSVVLAAALLAEPEAPELVQARARVEVAHKLFGAGHYALALDEYQRALPVALAHARADALRWNIARCHEALGQTSQAVAILEGLAAEARDPAVRVRARDKLAVLGGERSAPEVTAPVEAPPEEPGPWRWAAAGGVGALLAGSTALLVASQVEAGTADSAWRRYRAAETPEEAARERAETRAHETRARDLRTGAWIGFSLTALGAAGTALLFLDEPAPAVVWTPDGAALGWGGAF